MNDPVVENSGGLTPSEEQLLEFIRDGRVDAEIAVRLGISNAEVKERTERLARKMRARDRAELRSGAPEEELAPADDTPRRTVRDSTIGRWRAATAALAILVTAMAVFVFVTRGDGANEAPTVAAAVPSVPIGDVTVTPEPQPTPTAHTIVLDGRVMLDAGQLFKGGAQPVGGSGGVVPASVEARESLLVVELEWAAVLQFGSGPAEWSLWGAGPHVVQLVGNIGNVTYLVAFYAQDGTEFIFGDDDSVSAYSRGPGGPEIAIWASSQLCECYYHVDLRTDGHLYISEDLIDWSLPVAFDTGELLDLSRTTEFGSAGRRSHRTICARGDYGGCHSLLLGGDFVSAQAGVLTCAADEETLTFVSNSTTLVFDRGEGAGTLACREAERDVAAGEPFGYGGVYSVTAVSGDGSQLSVVITNEGKLFVGEVTTKFGCPCRSGR